MITLGIETSCDETSCGIVNDKLEVLANKIYTQTEHHKVYGGVVPEIASRAHLEKISPIVRSALEEAKLDMSQVDQIAFTRGPGLVGALLVGASFARGLAKSLNKTAYGINHLEGHLAAAYLSDKDLATPFVCLTVSGGHTELCVAKENFEYEILGKTRDDASGEAFDKCGKILGLGYPAGPLISKHAETGDRNFVAFPRGLEHSGNFEFSFSGLKTSFLNYINGIGEDYKQKHLNDICASVESAIVEVLVKKSVNAVKSTGHQTLVICGGVSANKFLRNRLMEEGQKNGFKVVVPAFSLCTDNGAMIAGIAQLRANQNNLPKVHKVLPYLPLDGSFHPDFC